MLAEDVDDPYADSVALWRWALLGLVSCAIIGWTAAMVPELIDGFTADCAEASSEVSDPCS